MLGGDGMSILDNQSVIDDERSAALGYTHSMVGSKAGSGEDGVFMSDFPWLQRVWTTCSKCQMLLLKY